MRATRWRAISISAPAAAVGGKYPGMWSSAGFVPIGDATKFTGSFDGQGRTISNLTINRPTNDYVGLFGYVGIGGTVQDVGLLGADRDRQERYRRAGRQQRADHHGSYAAGDGERHGQCIGGLVGHTTLLQAHHENLCQRTVGSAQFLCRRTCRLKRRDRAGLRRRRCHWPERRRLAGYNGGTITQAYAAGTVSGAASSAAWSAATWHRHPILLGHGTSGRYGRHRNRNCNRRDRPDDQPDAGSCQLRHHLRGLGFRHRVVGAERRLLSAALRRQLRPARRSRQCVAGLRRCQPGSHLYGPMACTRATHQPFSPASRCRRRRQRRPMSAATRSQRAAASPAPPGRPIA